MKIYMNIGHCQFDLWLAGEAQQIIGKMIHCDEDGCQLLKESDGTLHSYSWNVIQHITTAP